MSVLVSIHENIDDLIRKFPALKETVGKISRDDLRDAFEALGTKTTGIEVRDLISQQTPGLAEFDVDTVLKLYCALKIKHQETSLNESVKNLNNPEQKQQIRKFSGTGNEWTVHTIGESEHRGYAGWINKMLVADEDLRHLLPISPTSDELYEKLRDGLILCKLINCAVPGTIPEKAINKLEALNGPASLPRINENLNLAISSAAAIGCHVVNVGAEDILQKRAHIILSLLWQIIRIGLLKDISLTQHKELVPQPLPSETIDDLRQLNPEDLLLRWVNYHLVKAGTHKKIRNFEHDIMDSEAYAHLLSQIAPSDKKREMRSAQDILSSADNVKKAEEVLENADKLNAAVFLTAEDIAYANEKGKNRDKLNMAFVANLFNNFPALESTTGEDVYITEETLEEKTVRNWLKSLGVDPFVTDLIHSHTGVTMTKNVLDERQRLETYAAGIRQDIRLGVGTLCELEKEMKTVRDHKADVEQSNVFFFTVLEESVVRVKIPEDQFVTNCLVCYRTCHFPCAIREDMNKSSCCAMNRYTGKCNVCAGKCDWVKHKNNEFRYVVQKKYVTMTLADLKAKYSFDSDEDVSAEALIQVIFVRYVESQLKVSHLIIEAKTSLEILAEVSLRPDPLSELEYIDRMIMEEQQNGIEGFEERIKQLRQVREMTKCMEQLREGDFIPLEDHVRSILTEYPDVNYPPDLVSKQVSDVKKDKGLLVEKGDDWSKKI